MVAVKKRLSGSSAHQHSRVLIFVRENLDIVEVKESYFI